MATTVEMPKLGNTVEDCLLAVAKAQRRHGRGRRVIAEIETDKTSFELTAPVGGVLLETFFQDGALVPVFTVICASARRARRSTASPPGALRPRPGQAAPGALGRAPPRPPGAPSGRCGARRAGAGDGEARPAGR